MEPKPISPMKITKAAAVGIAAGVLSCYLLVECRDCRYGDYTGQRPRQSQSAARSDYFPEALSSKIRFGEEKMVGGFSVRLEQAEAGLIARVGYETVNGSVIDNGIILKQGKTVTLPIPDKGMRIEFTLHAADSQGATLAVTVR